MGRDDDSNHSKLDIKMSTSGEQTCKAMIAREIISRIEHDIAYSSEKVLNLDMLLMHITNKEFDHETHVIENEDVNSTDSILRAFEICILYGFLSSEIKEIDCFMKYLHEEISDVCQKIFVGADVDMFFLEEVEEKLHNAEQIFNQTWEQVSVIKKQSAKFEGILPFRGQESGGSSENNSRISESSDFHWKTLTMEQQMHTLHVLEKTLARELDLEKMLLDAKYYEEELRLKLYHTENETSFMEETIEDILEKLFETENIVEVLMGMSKELMGKLQLTQFKREDVTVNLKSTLHQEDIQFHQNPSLHQDCEMGHTLGRRISTLSTEKSGIEDLATSNANCRALVHRVKDMKASIEESDGNNIAATSEAIALREIVISLEQQLAESSAQLQHMRESIGACQEKQNILISEINDRENVILILKENISKEEIKAKNAEAKLSLLTATNSELNKELSFLKGCAAKGSNFLEERLKESDVLLVSAKASVEAIEDQQSVLYSVLCNMERLVQDLKNKVLKAEKRLERADSKCSLLSETNLELSEELNFLTTRLESLEKYQRQANDTKTNTAADISVRTKTITDLVTKVASERERLEAQISALKQENASLVVKFLKSNDNSHRLDRHLNNESVENLIFQKSSEDSTSSYPANFQFEHCRQRHLTEDNTAAESYCASVRSRKDSSQLSLIHGAIAVLVLIVSMILAVYLLRLQRLPT